MAASKGGPKLRSSGGGTKPGRSLVILLVLVIAGFAAMFGTDATSPRLAIDLAGGTSVTLTAKPLPAADGGKGGKLTPENMLQAVQIIRKRVNSFGVSEAQVTTLGADNIVVAIPGNSSSNVAQQVGQTALLRFREVIQEGPPTSQVASSPSVPSPGGMPDMPGMPGMPGQPRVVSGALLATPPPGAPAVPVPPPPPSAAPGSAASTSPISSSSTSPAPTTSAAPTAGATPAPSAKPSKSPQEIASAGIPDDVKREFVRRDCTRPDAKFIGDQAPASAYVVACDRDGAFKYVLGPSEVQGTDVSNALASLPQGANVGAWQIDLTFNGHGTSTFADVTKRLAGQPRPLNQLAITLDGVVQSAPTVNEQIASGQAQITGGFTQQDATDLANVLKYGALPLAFTQSTVQTVSATLGSDQLQGGLIAGALGLLVVVAYCLFFYRGIGAAALTGLGMAAVLLWMSVSLLGNVMGYRLSIAGIAGLIVAIGITADSFVLFFERLRDEIRDGRTPRAAVEYGWKRAWLTIRTANVVSLLASAVLYYYSVADVKGFAFTLGLATLIDVLVIVMFTKPTVTLLMRMPYFAKGGRFSGVGPESLGSRRGAARLSTLKGA